MQVTTGKPASTQHMKTIDGGVPQAQHANIVKNGGPGQTCRSIFSHMFVKTKAKIIRAQADRNGSRQGPGRALASLTDRVYITDKRGPERQALRNETKSRLLQSRSRSNNGAPKTRSRRTSHKPQ